MIAPPLNNQNNYPKDSLDYSKVTLPEWAIPHHVPTDHPYWLYGHYQDYNERFIKRMKQQYKDSLDNNGNINERLWRMFFGYDSPSKVLDSIEKQVRELEEFTKKYPDAIFDYDNT